MLDDAVLETQQRRKRAAMTGEELDRFLGEQRTARLATNSSSGVPHVSAIWFAWDGSAMWFYSIVKSLRWEEVAKDPRVAVIVDAGHEFSDLHGVELRGRLDQVGEVPRTGEGGAPELAVPERLFAAKYAGSTDGVMAHDHRHAWLRLQPEKVVSWDFRKTL